MSLTTEVNVQIKSIKPGLIGGAICFGEDVDRRRRLVCKFSYKTMERLPTVGEIWRLTGIQVHDKEHGLTINVSSGHVDTSLNARYLKRIMSKHPALRGIHFGSRRVNQLFDYFNAEQILRYLNSGNSDALATAIPKPIAERVVEAWSSLKRESDLIEFFTKYDVPSNVADALLSMSMDNALLERITHNPYCLVALMQPSLASWKIIDRLAASYEIQGDDERRLTGAIEFLMYRNLDIGHTAIAESELKIHLSKLLKRETLFESAILAASRNRAICYFNNDSVRYFQSVGAALIESSVEKSVQGALKGIPPLLNNDFAFVESFAEASKTLRYDLTQQQADALCNVFRNPVSVITGAGGTGKTTILKLVFDICSAQKFPCFGLALAGKAVEKLRTATGADDRCHTMHSFISLVKRGEISLCDDFLIVIDEASMIDIALAHKLIRILEGKKWRLALVGDKNQISPIGFGVFFHAIVGKAPTQVLDVIHRGAGVQPLLDVSLAISKGNIPDIPSWRGEESGCFFVECKPDQKSLLKEVERVYSSVPGQILTAHASTGKADNVSRINQYMQFVLNTDIQNPKPMMLVGDTKIMVNDPIIVSQNNYSLGLFNGTTGTAQEIAISDDEVKLLARFGEREVWLTQSECSLLGLQLAYGVTVHKAQGSEYEVTLFCCGTDSPILDRGLLYTALTRSKRLTIIVGRREVFEKAVLRPNKATEVSHGFALQL